jgi:hypothetical protein
MSLFPIFAPSLTLVNTTTECSVEAGGNVGWTNRTIWDRGWAVDVSTIVSALAWTSTVAESAAQLYISERIGATTYRTKATVAANHTGSGKEWFVLATPFVVPSSGTFYVGVFPGVGAHSTTKGTVTEAYSDGKASTTIDVDATVTEGSNGAFSVCAQYAEYQ